MMAAYTHRNGETELPTIDGDFWFRGKRGDETWTWHVSVSLQDSLNRGPRVSGVFMGRWDDDDPLSIYEGQWWGPIPDDVPPWDEQ